MSDTAFLKLARFFSSRLFASPGPINGRTAERSSCSRNPEEEEGEEEDDVIIIIIYILLCIIIFNSIVGGVIIVFSANCIPTKKKTGTN